MEAKRILTILALCLWLWMAADSLAVDMGTAFTYQGRLIDGNDTAQGVYDIIFHLYDSPEGPNEIGEANVPNVEIVDGYFTVELGFDVELFNGDWLWFEISIRPGDSNDPDGYIPLSPRQQITAAPYALYARRAGIEAPLFLMGSTDPEAIIGALNESEGPALMGYSTFGYGVYGKSTTGHAVVGQSTAGTFGFIASSDYGVYGRHDSTANTGLLGSSNYGVYGMHTVSGNWGYIGSNGTGVYGYSSSGNGIGGYSDTGNAGYFSGNVNTQGDLYVSGNVGVGTLSPGKKLEVDYGDILVKGVENFTAPGDKAIIYMGDTNHSIRVERGFGLKLGTLGAQDGLILRESTGNVGIGNTADNYKLEIGNTAESTNYARIGSSEWGGILFYDGQGSHSGSILYHHEDDTMQFQTRTAGGNPTEQMRISSSGNVGIGTINPEYQLDVAGVVNLNKGKTETALRVDGDEALWYNGTYFSWGYGGTANYFADYVGIGTSTPSQRLEVEGVSPRILVDATSGNPELNLQAPGKTRWSMYQDETTGDLRFYQAGDKIIFRNETGDVNIVSNLKIGEFGSEAYVMIEGDIFCRSSAGNTIKGVSSSNGTGVRGDSISGTGVYGSGDTAVEGNGLYYDFYASGMGTDYGSSSSIRWKHDIRQIDEPLDKVCRLRGVYFTWDAEHGSEHDVGMIAEEVGEVLPEIVQYEKDSEYAKGMDYSRLTPLLVEAVKELKTEVDELRKANAQLRDRLEAIEKNAAESYRLREGVVK